MIYFCFSAFFWVLFLHFFLNFASAELEAVGKYKEVE